MPDPRRKPSGERVPVIRMTIVALLLTLSTATLIGSVVPARDGLHRTQRMLDAKTAENDGLDDRLTEMAVEEDALENDVWLNQRILRSYQMHPAEEIIVRPSEPSDERPR